MRKRSLGLVASWVALSSVASSACLERRLESVAPCTRSSVTQNVRVQYVDTVDLLFVIDDSGSMEEEQRSLEREIPRLVQVLASGDRDGDGTEDFRPVRSLQVGVVSTDLGAGVPTPRSLGACVHGVGEGGVLLRTASGCGVDDDGVFSFARGDDPTSFVDDVSCVTTLGTTGCGLEQPLEAALRAITPAEPTEWTAPGYTPPRFLDPESGAYTMPGHALGANSGFVRPDSVLAVVLVTDEEDCSANDTTIFGDDPAAATRFGGDVQLRCTRFADRSAGVLHAVERYVDGLVALRRDPALVVFSVIAGIPGDLLPSPAELATDGIDYGRILADPRMQYVETGDRENFLRDACTTGTGSADPARRIVETALELDARGAAISLASICDDDFGPAIDGVVTRIADALNGTCLPRDLNSDADGRVACEVYEVLPAAGTTSAATECARLSGRTLHDIVEIDGVARERCLVTQLDLESGISGTGAGWYYDSISAERAASCGEDGQRIAFTASARPGLGTVVQLECLQTLGRTEGSSVECDERVASCEMGMFCEPGARDRCGTGSTSRGGASVPFTCDAVERLCAVPCTTDSDCRSSDLSGYVCDLRTNATAAGSGSFELDPATADSIRGTCVNPTCN